MQDILPWFLALRRNPRQMGAILPATRVLAGAMARTAFKGRPEAPIVEIGAGSGNVTEALWRMSDGRVRIRAIEPDKKLAEQLRRRLPEIDVINGVFEENLKETFSGLERPVLVSSVPLFSLEDDNRSAYFSSLLSAVKHGLVSRYVQYTYWPVLPWPDAKTLCGTGPRLIARNLPPAWIWSRDH